MAFEKEPKIKVGVIENSQRVTFRVDGEFKFVYDSGEERVEQQIGRVYEIYVMDQRLFLGRPGPGQIIHSRFLTIEPLSHQTQIILFEVPIGKQFHWQRNQEQSFFGNVIFKIINIK